MTSNRKAMCVFASFALLTGCERFRGPEAVTAPQPAMARNESHPVVHGSKHPRPDEAMFVKLANEIPGFAGYFLDNEKRLVAYVKDSTQFTLARGVLNRHRVSSDLNIPRNQQPNGMVIRKAKFDFQQLSDWRDIATDSLLGSYHVVETSVDEAINKVGIGVASEGDKANGQLLAKIREYGIPMDAVDIQVMGVGRKASAPLGSRTRIGPSPLAARSRLMTVDSLNAFSDTLGGGFKFSYLSGTNACSIGIGADSGSARIFLTASHCSRHIFGVTSTDSASETINIANESGDPAASGSSCGGFPYGCWGWRSSDAATYHMKAYPIMRRGMIARPTGRVFESGGVMPINSSNHWISVNSTGSAVYGVTVDQVGHSTGWTYGTIKATCVDRTLSDQGDPDGYIKIYCESKSDSDVLPGDSGGPVFIWDGADGATLVGITSERVCFGLCADDLFSTIGGVFTDFPGLNVLSDITVAAPGVTATLQSGLPYMFWAGVFTSGTNQTTEYRVYRNVWDASTYTWSEMHHLISTSTGLTKQDTTLPFSGATFVGSTQPAECEFTSVFYYVVAYNSGVYAATDVGWYQGPADGPTPQYHSCS